METIRRMPVCRILTEQQRKWLDSSCCPICGLPKSEWKRRIDWTCCSVDCTKKYSDEHIFVWQYWKVKAFERDNFTCVKCGFAPKEKKTKSKLMEDGRYNYFEVQTDNPDCSKLIGDHIIPIAIGGEEYDLDNVQTLCEKCNKVKTKKDLREIALYRKKHKSQTKLQEVRNSSHA